MTECNPVDRPAKGSWVMERLFDTFLTSYSHDSFPVEWLQKTGDLKVCCRDTSDEKVAFPLSPDLLKAIRKNKRITTAEKIPQRLPSNWGFSGFMNFAAHEVLGDIPIEDRE
ncbi:hypothetical protein FQN54_007225 [Arachnomyces sp. PD_36]|nr:hypothetical protein FQN54_007225 [Arachnomyces sp. PD_36]